MKRRKIFQKHFFTLIEVLIAMALASILIVSLGYFYREMDQMNQIMDAKQNRYFERLYLQSRLTDIFQKIPAKAFFFLGKDLPGVIKPATANLIFLFDNCVRLDKQFAYLVTGRLYVDTEGNLTLARWPAPKFWVEGELPPVKKEILMEGVEELSFLFFAAPFQEKKKQEVMPAEFRGIFQSAWNPEWKEVPAIVKIILKREDEVFEYAVVIAKQAKTMTYKE